MKKFKCTVCGYVHTGEEPPEKCPVCGAPAAKFIERDPSEAFQAEAEFAEKQKGKNQGDSSNAGRKKSPGGDNDIKTSGAPADPLSRLLDIMVKKHLHPISVHFPNGILPAALLFLLLAMGLDILGLADRDVLGLELSALHDVAFLNLAFVVLAMPVVLFSGFLDWKKHYRGIMTRIIRTKMTCGFIVLGLGVALLVWRLAFPESVTGGGLISLLYFLVNAGMLAAAGVAGNRGGRLVFGKK